MPREHHKVNSTETMDASPPDTPAEVPEPTPVASKPGALAAAEARIRELEAKLATGPPVPVSGCPPNGPYGDKTPEVLEWLAVHDPHEFVRRHALSGGTLIKKLLPQAQARCLTK